MDAIDNHGETVMHRMMKLGIWSQPVIRMIMDQRANLRTQNDAGESVTLLAVRFAPKAVLKLMAENGLNVEEKDNKGDTFLMKAVVGQEISQDRVGILLESGASVNATNDIGTNVLRKAMQSDLSEHLIKMLLDAGADVNERLQEKPILHSAVAGKAPFFLIKLLVEAGADLNLKHRDRPLILHQAIMSKVSTDIIEILLNAGASTKATDSRGYKALDQAISWKSTRIVKVLIDHGVDVNSTDYSNGLALSQALREGPEDMAEIIIKSGADTNKVMGNGEPPIIYVTKNKRWNMAHILVENGAIIQPPSAYAYKKDNPFYWSIQGQNPALLRFFLRKVEDETRWADLDLLRDFITIEQLLHGKRDEMLDDIMKGVLADFDETPRGPKMSWRDYNESENNA